MRAATERLQQILRGQQVIRCNLFTFRFVSGAEYHWTDGDVDVHAAGRRFLSSGPSIRGAKLHLTRGIQTDSLDLIALIKPNDLIMGVPWSIAVRSGALDAAIVTIERAYMPAWGDPAETLLIFSGEVADCGCSDLAVQITIKSDAAKLDAKVPAELFQPGCRRRLYTGGCTVSRVDNTRNGAIVAASTRYELRTSLTMSDGFFSLGDVLFTSGANTGVRRAIKSYTLEDGKISLSFPLHFDVALGDSFVAAAGCDRTRGAGGCAKFGAGIELRFNGTPYVPAPESII